MVQPAGFPLLAAGGRLLARTSAGRSRTMPAGRQVGFVGLGNMGGRMTRRLVAAGVRVVGYDVRAGQAESVGAAPAPALGDVCAGTEVVLLSLPDSRAVEAVVFGARPESDGLLD